MTVIIYMLIAASMIAVVGSLGIGLIGFSRGGVLNSRLGNRMMAWRVKTQAIAVVVLMFGCWWISAHRG